MMIGDSFLPYDYSRCSDMTESERLEHEWNDLMAEIAAAERMRDATLAATNGRIDMLVKLADRKKAEWLKG